VKHHSHQGKALFLVSLILILPISLSAKSSYPPNNYYEDGSHYPMCMRCHMVGPFNPAGTTLSLSSSKSTVNPGEQLTITVTRGNFNAAWNPGVVLHFANGDKYAQRIPQDYGWEVVSNPGGQPYNFYRVTNSATTQLVWTMKAPRKPGACLIATSAYLNDGGMPGTKRGDNTITINVNKIVETQKPVLLSVASFYKIYVFLKFSEPVEETSASTLSNYSITRVSGAQPLAIKAAFLNRDGTQVVLKTDPHTSGSDYTLSAQNVLDYASTPNAMAATQKTYTPDLVTPYLVPCNYSQDVTSTDVMFYDQVEYLGSDASNLASRIDLSFYHTPSISQNLDKPIDGLTGINFQAAKLYLRQVDAPHVTGNADTWNLFTISGSLMADAPIAEFWSGSNESGAPVASFAQKVGAVNNGLPATWWTWDVTQSFRASYQSGAGSSIQFRIRAGNEATAAQAGFYGGDADSNAFRPFIALIMDTSVQTQTEKSEIARSLQPALSARPNPFNSTVEIETPISADLGQDRSHLSIFDSRGMKIRDLHSGKTGGTTWDGKDGQGNKLPNGIYFVRLEQGNYQATRSLMLVR
jgi:hypothetical protein